MQGFHALIKPPVPKQVEAVRQKTSKPAVSLCGTGVCKSQAVFCSREPCFATPGDLQSIQQRLPAWVELYPCVVFGDRTLHVTSRVIVSFGLPKARSDDNAKRMRTGIESDGLAHPKQAATAGRSEVGRSEAGRSEAGRWSKEIRHLARRLG